MYTGEAHIGLLGIGLGWIQYCIVGMLPDYDTVGTIFLREDSATDPDKDVKRYIEALVQMEYI